MEDTAEKLCWVCGTPITEDNDSEEHPLLEALGGRLKVKGFICGRSNSEAGHTWDADLARQLLPLIHLHGVKRQRGETPGLPIVTTAGEELTITPDGGFRLTRPTYREVVNPDGSRQIQIVARTRREARQMLKGVQRKYPNVDIDTLLTNMQIERSYPKGLVPHNLAIGGEVAGRSIVKGILAMAYHAGVLASDCQDALKYLRQEAGAIPCFGYYQAADLLGNRPAEVPVNCVAVEANAETGLILGYAEYFGVFRIVACVGRHYRGKPTRACYAIDPRSGQELNISVNLDLTESDIDAIYDYRMIPDGALQKAFADLMPSALRRKFEAEKTRVVTDAIEFAFANCGAKPGDPITPELAIVLSRLAMERLMPFITQALSRPRLPPSQSAAQ